MTIPSTRHHPFSYGNGTIQCLRVGKSKSILIAALNRPCKRNAWNNDLYNNAADLLDEVTTDPSISAVVLTGVGRSFTTGHDLREWDTMPKDEQQQDTRKHPIGRFLLSLLEFPKVICAAVNGPAVGIGVTLLLHCDVVYCSPAATFWTPFPRIAAGPKFCSSVLFVEQFGLTNANEMFLLSKKIDTKTAVQWNMVSKIVSEVDESSGDPFHPNSLASWTANQVDTLLLQLPRGPQTAEI